mgnify:CR=1 FL=1
MNIGKYIVLIIFFSFLSSKSYTETKDSTGNFYKEMTILNQISKKHNLDFYKQTEIMENTFDCLNKDADHIKIIQESTSLLNLLLDILINFPDGFKSVEHIGGKSTLVQKRKIVKILNNISWCFQDYKEYMSAYIDLVRKFIDLNHINSEVLYSKSDEKVYSQSIWMNYSWFVEQTREDIKKSWPYDEKILKILKSNPETLLHAVTTYIQFSNYRLKDNHTREKILKLVKPILYSKKIDLNNKDDIQDFIRLSEDYFAFLIADKNYKECIKYYNDKIKSIDFSYDKIKNKITAFNNNINCQMNSLNWDESFAGYEEKIQYLDDALEKHKFDKDTEIEIYNQLIDSLIAVAGGYNITGFSQEEFDKKVTYLERARKLNDNYMKSESLYRYLYSNKNIIDQDIYNLEIDKAEKNLNSSLLLVEKFSYEDYPYKKQGGFENQKKDLEVVYLESLASIFVQTKRYSEAIKLYENIIRSSENILSVSSQQNLKITDHNTIEAFQFKAAHVQLLRVYILVSDLEKQKKYVNKISEWCNKEINSYDCLFFFQQKMEYAKKTRNIGVMNEAYDEMKNYYEKFSTKNIYVNFMTDTELLRHKVSLYAVKELEFTNDPKKINSKEHLDLRKLLCNELKKFEKKSNRIEKHLAKTVKNKDYIERTSYINAGLYFMKQSSKCKISKSHQKKSLKLFQQIIEIEKNKLDIWMNLPSNFYQYEVNTDLISQIGSTIAYYKDEFDTKKNLNEYDKLLREIFSLTQYGKNLFITNSIKNSINSIINENNDFKNLIYKRNTMTTKLDILTKDILNSVSLSDKKFEDKNNLEKKLKNINLKISKDFPELNKNLKTKFYNVEDVQDSLNDGEVFIVFDSFDFIFAHIITKKSYDVIHHPTPMDYLKESIYILRKLIFLNDNIDEIKDGLSVFYNSIFKKIEDKIEDNKKIIIVTDKYTENIPFGIIYDKTNEKYLSEKYSLSYQPSVGSFVELRKKIINNKITFKSNFLGIGNPLLQKKTFKDYIVSITDFNITRGGILKDSSIISEKYENLPYSGKELKSISKLFSKNKLLLSKNANEKTLKELDLGDFDIISFATHAAVSGELRDASEPFLVLTPPEKTSFINDGILTASEISQLNLKAKLVILSACNTASKENEYAPGFSGLVAAFFKAGAESIIATHWPVADKTTSIMLEETINKTVRQGIDLDIALQLTKVEFIQGKYGAKYQNPKYWAPYVVIGN